MWKSLHTTNALENLNREFRRRTKTQASFSTEASALTMPFGLVPVPVRAEHRLFPIGHFRVVLLCGLVDFRRFGTDRTGYISGVTLFAHLGKHEIFTPTMTYPPMTMNELACAAVGDAPKEAVRTARCASRCAAATPRGMTHYGLYDTVVARD